MKAFPTQRLGQRKCVETPWPSGCTTRGAPFTPTQTPITLTTVIIPKVPNTQWFTLGVNLNGAELIGLLCKR